MSEPTEHVVDRTGWPAGPWDDEPDRAEWRAKGTPRVACLMVRNAMGAWCGYVGVPPGHPWHGLGYDQIDAEAHGGLTYSDSCGGPICHVPRLGESDDVWWVGFDCIHYMDDAPGLRAMGSRLSGEYRTEEWVRAEVNQLAQHAQGVCK